MFESGLGFQCERKVAFICDLGSFSELRSERLERRAICGRGGDMMHCLIDPFESPCSRTAEILDSLDACHHYVFTHGTWYLVT